MVFDLFKEFKSRLEKQQIASEKYEFLVKKLMSMRHQIGLVRQLEPQHSTTQSQTE